VPIGPSGPPPWVFKGGKREGEILKGARGGRVRGTWLPGMVNNRKRGWGDATKGKKRKKIWREARALVGGGRGGNRAGGNPVSCP